MSLPPIKPPPQETEGGAAPLPPQFRRQALPPKKSGDPVARPPQLERVPLATMSDGVPSALLPRPPRYARREYLRARALNQRSLPATSRPAASSYNYPLDKPAQRRYHTERATRRVFARVPTYLPRMKSNALVSPDKRAKDACTMHQQVKSESGSSKTGASSKHGNGGQPGASKGKKLSKIEARMKEMQLLRDKVAIKEAFAVIDDDGGGSVEAPEVLKALKALGKKLDDKKFWPEFQKLCDDGAMVISEEQFEKLMLKVVESSRRKAAKQPLGGELRKQSPSLTTYHDKKRAFTMGFQVKGNMKSRLSKVRERKEFGDSQAAVRRTRLETLGPGSNPLQSTAHLQNGGAQQEDDTLPQQPSDTQTTMTTKQREKDGSEWMVEALEQHRGLKDIYTALTSLRSSTMQARIADPPEDVRLRTSIGRAMVEQERSAMMTHGGLAEENEEARKAAGLAIIDMFAEMFT